jgi:hypothetical protein
MNNLKKAIAKNNLASYLEEQYPNSKEFDLMIQFARESKVLMDAEKIYNHYLPQGIEIAQKRKEQYIKNN